MERLFLRRGEVASKYAVSSWQSVMFSEFEAQMSSEARPFPCVFGVAGHRQDQLRYLFLDPYDIEVLGEQLAQYVSESRSFGPNTSLIVFTRPRPVQTLDAYYRKMWLTLDQLGAARQEPVAGRDPRTDRSSDVGVFVRRRADFRGVHDAGACDAAEPPLQRLHAHLPAAMGVRENSRDREGGQRRIRGSSQAAHSLRQHQPLPAARTLRRGRRARVPAIFPARRQPVRSGLSLRQARAEQDGQIEDKEQAA